MEELKHNKIRVKGNSFDNDWLLIFGDEDQLIGRINKVDFESDEGAIEFSKQMAIRYNSHPDLQAQNQKLLEALKDMTAEFADLAARTEASGDWRSNEIYCQSNELIKSST